MSDSAAPVMLGLNEMVATFNKQLLLFSQPTESEFSTDKYQYNFRQITAMCNASVAYVMLQMKRKVLA